MPFLEREFPDLVKSYRRLYTRSAYLEGEYKEVIRNRMAELRDKYGLVGERAKDQITAQRLPGRRQLALSFLNSSDSGLNRASS